MVFAVYKLLLTILTRMLKQKYGFVSDYSANIIFLVGLSMYA